MVDKQRELESSTSHDGCPDDGSAYEIGVGIADVTGPAAEVGMMGYAKFEQQTSGIHMRLYSRAFIFVDGNGNRICYVIADIGMIGLLVRMEVVKRLKLKYGDLYTDDNVMLAGTHTHSGPGGFLQYFLYIFTTQGFVFQNFYAIVEGIIRSIERAHENVIPGYIYYNQGELLDASVNRSPTAYDNNPVEERAKYKYNTDKTMYLLKLTDLNGKPIGVLNWFAVHPTSMNNTNTLISGDNKGYASILFEKESNPGQVLGKGPFVAGFANANLGDVSPNTRGPHCIDTGLPCDSPQSSCKGTNRHCIALGPGSDMFESTKIIGYKQYEKAKELFETATERVKGSIGFIHQFVDMTKYQVKLPDGSFVSTCQPAMGYSFAAGTTDGPGAFDFKQGTTTSNTLWNLVRDVLSKPTKALQNCHQPKPILLATGQMFIPYKWQPTVLPTQVLKLGNILIPGFPAELTTMSGRRARDVMKNVAPHHKVIISGLSNAYSSYVTTFEEYQIQRYEGASTAYGPHTLAAYLQQYEKLTEALMSQKSLDRGPAPINLLSRQMSLNRGVVYDMAPRGYRFGDCALDADDAYTAGTVVTVKFIAGHPKNDLMLDSSFLTVEKLDENTGEWKIIATDADWETKFIWERINSVLGQSYAKIVWEIPENIAPGFYKIKHIGYHKNFLQQVKPYSGETKVFKVLSEYFY